MGIISAVELANETFQKMIEESGNPIKPVPGFEWLYRRYQTYLTDRAGIVARRFGDGYIGLPAKAQQVFHESIMDFKKFAVQEIAAANYLGDEFQERFAEFLEDW